MILYLKEEGKVSVDSSCVDFWILVLDEDEDDWSREAAESVLFFDGRGATDKMLFAKRYASKKAAMKDAKSIPASPVQVACVIGTFGKAKPGKKVKAA